MKASGKLLPVIVSAFLLIGVSSGHAQLLKKLGKRAERAAERTVENRVDQETTKKTDQVLDTILEPGSKTDPTGTQVATPSAPSSQPSEPGSTGGSMPGSANAVDGQKSIEVYSKFDFVPGDKVIFFDDFSRDFIGDFPSKWNTNGSGQIVTINDSPEKWMELIPGWGTYYIPDIAPLPKDYTIEFDMLTAGLDNKTSSTAGMDITLSDDPKFEAGQHYVYVWLPVGQYGAFDLRVKNYARNVGSEINNTIRADIREAVLNRPHIAIAVNGQRFRMWVNENKYVDIPRFIPEGGALSTLKFNVNYLKDGKERIFITNLKVAEGGVDLRRKLIAEGKVSTNGILFDSGSATLIPQSMGVIRQFYQVLQQEPSMKLRIIGHTDSDGDDASNRALSKNRAETVKNTLVSVYGIDDNRLETEGKGETEPIADNNTAAGKAQNRRVEFVKI